MGITAIVLCFASQRLRSLGFELRLRAELRGETKLNSYAQYTFRAPFVRLGQVPTKVKVGSPVKSKTQEPTTVTWQSEFSEVSSLGLVQGYLRALIPI